MLFSLVHFKVRANAEVLRRKLEKLVGRDAKIIVEDNYFKVRISEITERADVDKNLEILRKNGITEVWVISLKAMKQQLVLTERQDTIRQITETLTNPGADWQPGNYCPAGCLP